MGFSFKFHDFDPFKRCPLTPGSLGINDAASPDKIGSLLGDTPGPLGCNDHATPDLFDGILGDWRLHSSLTLDDVTWDYDPDSLLEDPGLNPDFVQAAKKALLSAVHLGLHPRVHEAYRTPEESARKHKRWKQHKGGKAGDAWKSCHNYGLAMDVYLYDRKQRYIDNHVKGWYKQYKQLASAAIAEGFVWGESFDDSDHFEFHPKWDDGANGSFLLEVKVWAEQAAMTLPDAPSLPKNQFGPPPEPGPSLWMPIFWWAAGACGSPPPGEFLSKNSPPGQ